MAHKWVLDVLEDLKTFAQANGLPALARHLEEGVTIASDEMAGQEGKDPAKRYTSAQGSESDAGRFG